MKGLSRINAVQIIIFYASSCMITSPLIVPFVSSSSPVNRNNYNVYNYDQTTPQFTPDGRLLQVEYASSAADLSPPLIALEFFSPSSSGISVTGHETESTSCPCIVLITVPKQSSSPQSRIVIIETNDSNDQLSQSSQMQKSPRPYCVAMSGILADSLALLQAGMKAAAEYSLQYQESFGIESLTQALADECQSRVFAGGLRPYGSTMLLCGYDNNQILLEEGAGTSRNKGKRSSKLHQSLIYQTDPSGGVLQHHARDSGDKENPSKNIVSKKRLLKNRETARGDTVRCQIRCIVGGSSSVQRQLRKQINQDMSRLEQQQQRSPKELSLSLAERIATVARILIKETVNNNETTNRTGNNGSKRRHSKESVSSSDYPLEVVVISPKLGCHRLRGKQLQAIKELINADKQPKS